MQHTAHHHAPLNTAGFAHPHRNVAALGIEPGMQVVDFGSGSGAYVIAIAEHLGGTGHVYAVDVQRDLLKRTQNEALHRKLKNISVIWGDLEITGGSKVANHHADVVLISNTLFQIDEKAAVLFEAHRILKPTGRLVIIDWSDSFGGLGPQKVDVLKKEDALALALDWGFELLREFPAGAHHYGLIFKVKPFTHKTV